MLMRIRKSQSILEYAVLIAIVVAAIVIMQVFIKRGVSGRLKDSADRISGGTMFSASNSTTRDVSHMAGDRTIVEMTATDDDSSGLAEAVGFDGDVENIVDQGGYSVSGSTGGETTSRSDARMDDATKEAFTSDQMTDVTAETQFDDLDGIE